MQRWWRRMKQLIVVPLPWRRRKCGPATPQLLIDRPRLASAKDDRLVRKIYCGWSDFVQWLLLSSMPAQLSGTIGIRGETREFVIDLESREEPNIRETAGAEDFDFSRDQDPEQTRCTLQRGYAP
jgi:hypothetical protein